MKQPSELLIRLGQLQLDKSILARIEAIIIQDEFSDKTLSKKMDMLSKRFISAEIKRISEDIKTITDEI